MLVKCPGCYTTYRVGDNLIGSSKPTFRCSRCKLIFALDLKSKVPDEPDNATIQTTLGKRGEEPSLPFPSSTEATATDNGEEESFSRVKTESEPPEIKTSLKEERPGERMDPFASNEGTTSENQGPLTDSEDSIAEIQRFLAESQEPPSQDQETFNRDMDSPMGSEEATENKDTSVFENQDTPTTTEETFVRKDEPLSPSDYFSKTQEPLTQSEDTPTENQENFNQSQETFFTAENESVTPAEETTAAAPENVNPFGYERQAPSRGEDAIAPSDNLEKAPDLQIPKPKVREYKGKTFGVKKKSPGSIPEADSTAPAPQPYAERKRPPMEAQETRTGGPVSIIPYISLFGILLLTFSLLTLIYQAQPAKLEAYLKSIPWFGSVLFKNSHLRQGVVLESLNSGFQKILGGRQVFVITGKISNRNPVSVRDIQLEGLIHTAAGTEAGRQTISVGNPISSKIIRDMTVREIAILQRLKPQKRFEIAPDGSAAFTIVFLKPSKDIKSFSCRVLSTKGSA